MDQDINRAIADSHLLLAFLGRARLVIDGEDDRKKFDEYTTAIAAAQQTIAAGGKLDAAQQAAFWRAFIFLSNLGSPATIESIRYYFDYYYDQTPATAKPAGHRRAHGRTVHVVFVTVVLFATLLLSLVGFIGGRALDQYAADSRHWYALVNIARLATFGEPLHAAFDRDGRTLLVGTAAIPPQSAPAEVVPPTQATLVSTRDAEGRAVQTRLTQVVQIPPERVVRLRAALPGLLDTREDMNKPVWHPACPTETPCVRRRDVLLAEEFVFTLAALNTERRILEWLLAPVRWVVPTRYMGLDDTPPPSVASTDTLAGCTVPNPLAVAVRQAAGAPREAAPMPVAAGLPAQPARATPDTAMLVKMMENPIQQSRVFLFILCNELPMPINLPPPLNSMMTMGFKADLALNVLNTYVLTLLFGLLGACVHVMREINRRLDDFTLTRGMLNRYWARVILGGVSGAFIGFFFNAGGELALVTGPGAPAGNLTSNLTGVALAFLAGFSVEVLFAILDRLTQVFRDFAYGAEAGRVPGPGAGPPVRQMRVQ